MEDGATVDEDGSVHAVLKAVTEFTDFSDKEAEQSGHYFPFHLTGAGEKMTVKKNGNVTHVNDIAFDADGVFRIEKTSDTFEIIVDEKPKLTLNFTDCTLQ